VIDLMRDIINPGVVSIAVIRALEKIGSIDDVMSFLSGDCDVAFRMCKKVGEEMYGSQFDNKWAAREKRVVYNHFNQLQNRISFGYTTITTKAEAKRRWSG
jgi:hypothetical protein